jgi:hypothetical protein
MSHEDRPIEPAVTPVDDGFHEGTADFVVDAGNSGRVVAPVRLASRAPIPFVWQHDTRVLLLDDDDAGWVMAELRFDAEVCRYQEVRRATYRLTREAIGAVLSRALASGDHAAVDTAIQLHQWLHTYYGISVVPDIIASPDAGSVEFSL